MKIFNEIKTVKGGFIFILILIIGIGVSSYRNANEVFETAEWRAHTYKILNAIEDVLTQLVGAEEGQRSYLITGDENYLQNYNAGRKIIYLKIQELKQMLKDNKVQLEKLDNLESSITLRFKSLQNTIEFRKNGNLQAVESRMKKRAGKKFMDEISTSLGMMQTLEYKKLQKWDKMLVTNVKNTFVTIIVGTLVSCVIFLTVFYILDSEISERKKIEKAIRQEMEFSERLLNSSIDGIVAFDKDFRYTLWNPGMEEMTGIKKSQTLGKIAFDVLPFLKEIGEDKYFYETLKGNYIIAKDRWFHIPSTKKEGYFEIYYSPIIDINKEITGGIAIVRESTQRKLAQEALEKAKEELEKRVKVRTSDLSKANKELRKEIIERKKAEELIKTSLQEKVVLLREIHHRVKNNLQVISSLLNLQSTYIEDPKSLEIFRESQTRVKTMALIHEKLYRSKDLNKIEFAEYIRTLVNDLFTSYNTDASKIHLKSKIEGIFLGVDTAILCGLIINELISNSLKHAFPNGKKGEIFIGLSKDAGNRFILIVKDNGIGFPKEIDFRNTESLGLQLVTTLTDQLGGTVELNKNG
ncbi:MAG TPA: PAS domain S-box protein, partial [Ignavibacteria bacterium]|nr:PAS domain S-box protein [Ignavibacteria bacterium]